MKHSTYHDFCRAERARVASRKSKHIDLANGWHIWIQRLPMRAWLDFGFASYPWGYHVWIGGITCEHEWLKIADSRKGVVL